MQRFGLGARLLEGDLQHLSPDAITGDADGSRLAGTDHPEGRDSGLPGRGWRDMRDTLKSVSLSRPARILRDMSRKCPAMFRMSR
jgi:hypothetical protein